MRYVQHKSGVGEKWEVHAEWVYTWDCTAKAFPPDFAVYLPKSEYVEVPAPELWEDVTKDVRVRRQGGLKGAPGIEMGEFVSHEVTDLAKLICPGNYRIRKVPICTGEGTNHEPTKQWAFIVEKQVQP